MWDLDLCTKAYTFAAKAHGEQKIIGYPLPYIYHVSLVAVEVMASLTIEKMLNDDLAVQCSFLHDVLEDTDCTHAQLAEEFGIDVANGVLALSKDENLPQLDRMPDSLSRIKKQPQEIWIVKLADRIVNLGSPPPQWTIEKRQFYLEEARLIHHELAISCAYLGSRLLEKIKEYELNLSKKF